MKPNIEKVSEEGGTGQFCRRQDKSGNFICKKENPVGICEDIKNDVFDLVPQGQTELFSNHLKDFNYTCGIKFQKNGSGVQYAVKNRSKLTISAPTEPSSEAVKTARTMSQKGILDSKIKKLV